MDEADVPTQRAQARQDSRFPEADVDEGRTGGDPRPAGQGAPAPVGLTPGERPRVGGPVGPIRSRRTYAELRRPSGRGRHGPVSISVLLRPDWDHCEVAYAVNRKVGNAVQRNRLRRRMRAIVAERAADLPTGAYLVRSGPEGPALEFRELKVAMSRAMEKATNRDLIPTGAARRSSTGGPT
jgi:ribonuclease P protein component